MAVTSPSNVSSPIQATSPHFLQRLAALATTPHASLTGEEERNARLALSLMFPALVLTILALIYTLGRQIYEATYGRIEGVQENANFIAQPLTAFLMLLCAIWLARTRQYRYGIYLMVLAPTMGALSQSIFLGGETLSQYQVYYFIVGTVIASLLLNARSTLVFAIFNFLAANLLILTTPSWSYENLGDELIFHVMVPTLLIISAIVRGRYLDRIQAQVEDLTRLGESERQARQRAERADQVKSAFLASMSHELRTPLNAIINFTRFVAKGAQGPINAEQKETLDEAIDSARHLLNLINDVLDMSKIEAGSLKLFLENNVDISPILDSVVASGRALTHDKDITLKVDIEDGLPSLTADRQRLLQILLNIMSNACKFTERGEIRLQARQEGDLVIISITDSGPGIAPEDREAVFTPFKQTQTGLRQSGGTGLGMPISQSLVEAHGGRIWLESEVGKGTTFFVAFPKKSATSELRAVRLAPLEA